MILGAVLTDKKLHSSTNMVIFNIALADLSINCVVESFAIAGKQYKQFCFKLKRFNLILTCIKGVLYGENLYNKHPGLCKFVAGFCLGLI
jgi:hypothetical protein